MKGIRLNVTVKYTVGVTCSVPDEVFESLEYMEDEYGFGFDTLHIDKKCEAAMDWLSDNIREADGCEWEYEITDLEEIGGEE